MDIVDEYFELQEQIYAEFSYEEGWRVYPLDDNRDVYWSIDRGTVYWSNEREHHQQYVEQEYEFDGIPDNDAYSSEIYQSVHNKESIYESKDKKYTMILVDTETDGNIFLMIFDNEKQIAG